MRRIVWVSLLALALCATSASAANVLDNPDWSTYDPAGSEQGWTQWAGPGEWNAQAPGNPTPAGQFTKTGGGGHGGWYQVVEAAAGTEMNVDADWTGDTAGGGWAEVMLFSFDHDPSHAEVVAVFDLPGGPGGPVNQHIAYKHDSFGLPGGATWDWEAASSLPEQGEFNNGTIESDGWVVVGLKAGGGGGQWAAWDNLVLTPEPATALLLGLPLLFLRRRRT